MTSHIRFVDGASYERYMGQWSQLVSDEFLQWLSAPAGWRWLDVGCGNGAFTEMLVARCAPSTVDGVDPSAEQIAFAQSRPAGRVATFQQGNALALPFGDDVFDAAVMPLVIAFVPDPAKGVAEMARVVRSGGLVSAYMWDTPGQRFPYQVLMNEMRAMGVEIPQPPRPEVSAMDALRQLWDDAALTAVETRALTVARTFESFEYWWDTVRGGPSVGPPLAAMPADALARLEARMRDVLPIAPDGSITYSATANAVKGVTR